MKVLHVIPAVAPRYGGPSTTIVEMCTALDAAGVSTTLVTTDADGPETLDVPHGVPTRWHGVSTLFFRRQWSEAFKYSHPLGRWLRQWMGSFEVVHVHGPLSYAALAAAEAARTASVPCIVRPLGTLDDWSLGQKALKKRLLLPLVARMVRSAAAVHCTSDEELRQVTQRFGIAHGVTIPLGIDPSWCAHSRTAPDTDNRYVLALSRLHPVKNLEALVEAFVTLPADVRRGWQLVIAGAGDSTYVRRLDDVIARYGTASGVTRRGWVDGAEKRSLVTGASLFAVPSHHENFGVGLVEAMATGVPVIASEGVHLARAIHDAGAGGITAGTVDALRRTLARAMGDDTARRAGGRAAAHLAARFAWPAVARSLSDLYVRVRAAARVA